jgi:hypothetical protein
LLRELLNFVVDHVDQLVERRGRDRRSSETVHKTFRLQRGQARLLAAHAPDLEKIRNDEQPGNPSGAYLVKKRCSAELKPFELVALWQS